MKRTLVAMIGLALLLAPLDAAAARRVTQRRINLTMTGAAIQLTTAQIYTPKFTVQSHPGNTNDLYIGLSDLAGATTSLYVISPGQGVTFTPSVFNADRNEEWYLPDYYLMGTAAETVSVSYEVLVNS